MVERVYIVSRGANGQNSQQLPILVVEEKYVNSKPYRWKWGIRDKTFWDWLDLLLAPFLVSLLLFWIGLYFDGRAKDKEEYFNSERNKQEILRNYLTTMTELISEGKLSDQNKTTLTQNAAKALTQSALKSFNKAVLPPESLQNFDEREQAEQDANRKGQVLQFLYDANLITKNSSKIDMESIDLTGANLEGIVLGPPKHPINLSKANLYKANLHKAQLVKAQMQGTQLPNAHLKVANLTGANLKSAKLQRAELQGANLQGADMSRADLRNAKLQEANLSGNPNVYDAKRKGAKLSDAQLNSAILRGADLKGADLSNAHLDGADLTDANLTGATLPEIADAILCRTTMPEGTVDSSNCNGQPQP